MATLLAKCERIIKEAHVRIPLPDHILVEIMSSIKMGARDPVSLPFHWNRHTIISPNYTLWIRFYIEGVASPPAIVCAV